MTVFNRIAVKLAFLLLSLPLICCGQSSPPASEAALQQEIVIKLGQTVLIKNQKLHIKFASVLEDSRCPKGEQCIQAGRGRIAIELKSGENETATLQLSTAPDSQEVEHLEYNIRLVDLSPYPSVNGRIGPDDYRATLVVDKNRAGGNRTNTAATVNVPRRPVAWLRHDPAALIRIL